jgi:hypothetical protein
MKLTALLADKRTEILAKWQRLIFETYAPETSRFLKREKDQFANPVGNTITRGIGVIYDHLAGETSVQEVLQPLDDIVRIKAVQDFSPGEALDFLFGLKRVVREYAETEIRENRISLKELLEFESRVDELVLHAFNNFMKCREKIYELKANQIQSRTYQLLKRANLLAEFPDPETGTGEKEKAK